VQCVLLSSQTNSIFQYFFTPSILPPSPAPQKSPQTGPLSLSPSLCLYICVYIYIYIYICMYCIQYVCVYKNIRSDLACIYVYIYLLASTYEGKRDLLTLWALLTLLNRMFSTFIHLTANNRISFLFSIIDNTSLCIYTTCSYRASGLFPNLAIMRVVQQPWVCK
jgi:hypothetical protein